MRPTIEQTRNAAAASDDASVHRGAATSSPGGYLPAALALGAVLAALATQFLITQGPAIPGVGLGFAVAATLLGGSAWSLARAPRTGRDAATAPQRGGPVISWRWELGLLACVIAAAIFFRFFRFTQFPAGLWYDEAVNGTDAFSIIDHDHLTVWRTSNFGHSTVYFYLLIVSFKAFGYSVFAFRIVPAVAGLVAVVAFYALARWLLGPIPALIATALLAVSRFAVTFSRVSWEASLEPALEIMSVYFFVRALETRSRLYFVLAGGSLAAGLYTYLGFRFVPVMIVGLMVYIGIAERDLLRRNLAGLALAGAAFIVVVAPLAQYSLLHPDEVLARTRDINVFREVSRKHSYEPLRHNLVATVQMMNVEGDRNGRHNLPGAPMIDEVSGALLVLGLAVSLWSARDWRKGGMALWLALALLPGALTISGENPSGIRAVGAIAPLFLVIGLAVAFLWKTLNTMRAGRAVFFAGALLLAVSSAGLNYHQFFGDQAHSQAVYDAFIPLYTDVGRIAARESAARDVYVAPALYDNPAVTALTRGKEVRRWQGSAQERFSEDGRDVVLIVGVPDFELIPALRQLYPHLERLDNIDRFGRIYFTMLTIPAGDIASVAPLRVTPPGAAPAF